MGRKLSFLPHLPRFAQACLAEGLGTFFLVLIICLSSANSSVPPIAIGFGLTSLVFSYGYVSKAQFNPAVSLGLYVAGIQDLKSTVVFTVVQCCTGFVAAVAGAEIMGSPDNFPVLAPKGGAATFSDSHAVAGAFFAEFLFTFNLAHTMINVAVSRQGGNSHFGLAIGMAVLSGAFSVGAISGGSFNPAVTTALQLNDAAYKRYGTGDKPVSFIWLYWLAELLGGLFAGLVFHLLDEEEEKEPDSYKPLEEVAH